MPGHHRHGFEIAVSELGHGVPVFTAAGQDLTDLVDSAGRALSGLGSFWGRDSAGTVFGHAYRPAQQAVLGRLATTASSVVAIGHGLQHMAATYAMTESIVAQLAQSVQTADSAGLVRLQAQLASSTPGAASSLPPGAAPPGSARTLPRYPRPAPAAGTARAARHAPSVVPLPPPQLIQQGEVDGQPYWHLLRPPWPETDEGCLLLAAEQWQKLARGIGDILTPAEHEATSITANNSGHAIENFTSFWVALSHRRGGEAATMAHACRAAGAACVRYADAVRGARDVIEEAGAEFAAELVPGSVTAYFAFGASGEDADGVAAALVQRAHQALADLTGEVPRIVADLQAAHRQILAMSQSGRLSADVMPAAEAVLSAAFGDSPPPLVQQIRDQLHAPAAAGAATGSSRTLADHFTRLADAVSAGHIPVADPAAAWSLVQFAGILAGPAALAGAGQELTA